MKAIPAPVASRLARVTTAAKRLRAQGWSAEDLQAISLELTGFERLEHLTLCSQEVLDSLAKRFESLIVQTPLEWYENGGRERQWADAGHYCLTCNAHYERVRRISGRADRLCDGCYAAELRLRQQQAKERKQNE